MGQAGHARVVSLGTPHMGAPLEQSVHYLSAALNALPETRPFGTFFRRRSSGIRDLRQGSLVDADWRDCDPRRAARAGMRGGAAARRRDALLRVGHAHARRRAIPSAACSATAWCSCRRRPGRSRTRRLGFRDEDGLHIGGASHFALLRHPQVYEQLSTWLA